jgi:hypothetical protein
MKIYLFLITLFFLYSCSSTKEAIDVNVINENLNQIDSLIIKDLVTDIDGDGVLDSLDMCPEEYGIDENGCPVSSFMVVIDKNKVIEKDFIKDKDKEFNKKVDEHKSKTNLKIVDNSSSDTTRGWISYSVPEQMKVAQSYSIKVRISKKINGQNKATLILGNSEDPLNSSNLPSVATISDVKVSSEMSAELRGDSESFDIKVLSTTNQTIDDESYTEWEWVVTPKKSGNNPLKLVIKVKDINKDIVVFNKNIIVKKNVTVAVEGFFEKYWQWFMTTIIIPIFIYFWNKKKKKKS